MGLRLFVCICLGLVIGASPAFAAAPSPSPSPSTSTQVTVDRSLPFRVLTHAAYIEFRWKRYSQPAAFRMYKIVRSEPGGPTAPDAGDIVATTTNRYSTNVEDHLTKSGTYYYRLCVVRKDANVVCSKVVKIVYVAPAAALSTVSFAPVVTSTGTSTSKVADAHLQDVSILSAPGDQLRLSLSASASGTVLTWTPFISSTGVSSPTILVRSFVTSSPSYPEDGYLAKIVRPAQTSFVDTVYVDPSLLRATRWYRACAVEDRTHLYCGSPVSIRPK